MAGFAVAAVDLARSAVHYRYAMQRALGARVADEEFTRALGETGTDERETRAAELRVLHDRLERNLTGLLGPTLARDILSHRRPDDADAGARPSAGPGVDARLLELRLEASRARLQGTMRRLDDLRRHLLDVLRALPVGVCSIDGDGCVLLWNEAMQRLTGTHERDARGRGLDALPEPWGRTLAGFATGDRTSVHRVDVPAPSGTRTVDMHRTDVGTVVPDDDSGAPGDDALSGRVLLVEDRTALQTLEAELAHAERLASIGRLAAGIAHEIGNPLTGIASLAQNLRGDAHEPDIGELVDEQAGDILVQVGRIDAIVRSLLGFAHAGDGAGDAAAFVANGSGATDVGGNAFVPASGSPAREVRIDGLVDEAIRLVALAAGDDPVRYRARVRGLPPVAGDPDRLLQVFREPSRERASRLPRWRVRVDRRRARRRGRRGTRGGRGARSGARPARARLRPVLHDEGRRRRHGAGPVDRARHRRRARRSRALRGRR